MGFKRRRSDRPDSARRRQFQSPERLESRQLLSSVPYYLGPYVPSDLFVTNPITHERVPTSIRSLVHPGNPNSELLNNRGKIVSGKDREGNEWTITVHGPGTVIVTDTTPNDGSLDDDIATIQIVNSDPNKTYVTGNTVASARTLGQTSGTVKFNRLIASKGVKAIDLNGFDLSRDVSPAVPATQETGVFLYGGVGRLSFHDILATIDTSETSVPYVIAIGTENVPLKTKPSIYLDSIYNSVFDSSSTTIPTGPLTTPSVQFLINGVIHDFNVVSVTQVPNVVSVTKPQSARTFTPAPLVDAAYQFQFSVVGTTGRTSLQASAIDQLNVRGAAKNLTASRSVTPFANSLTGLKYLRKAKFGGNADAVGLDVEGSIGSVDFNKGLGDPTGVFTARVPVPNSTPGQPQRYVQVPATSYGIPLGSTGYPAAGLQGGVVRAKSIGKVHARYANQTLQTAQNPDFVQLYRQGSTTFYANPGMALTNSAITAATSIGKLHVNGNQLNSEVKTGFDYSSYVAGLQGTRGASQIGNVNQKGDLINSVVSASFRPKNGAYSFQTGTAGAGSIRGRFRGKLFNTGGTTALGNTGAGFFARNRSAGLPPRV